MDWNIVYNVARMICLPFYWLAKMIVWSIVVLIVLGVIILMLPDRGYSELHNVGIDLYVTYNVDNHKMERVCLANRGFWEWCRPIKADLIPAEKVDSGYIDVYSYDSLWVILKYIVPDEQGKTFYIVDKSFQSFGRDSISVEEIKTDYIMQFKDSAEFAEVCRRKQITLTFEKPWGINH